MISSLMNSKDLTSATCEIINNSYKKLPSSRTEFSVFFMRTIIGAFLCSKCLHSFMFSYFIKVQRGGTFKFLITLFFVCFVAVVMSVFFLTMWKIMLWESEMFFLQNFEETLFALINWKLQ